MLNALSIQDPVARRAAVNSARKRLTSAANKPVTYLRIGKDDHSLVAPDSRTKALTAIAAFLKTHMGK